MLVLVLRAGAGSRPGGRGTCSLLRQRKVPKRKATLQSATPSRCYGANLRRGVCGVRRGTRFALARCARTTTASQITKHAREGAHATPQTPRRRRSQKGVGSPKARQPNSHTGHCCAWPSLRIARGLRPGGVGRAKRRPVWMSACGFPSGCAEERSGQRIRARDCLSEASSSETPLDASTAGCPFATRRGRRLGVAFSLVTFFWRSKRKLLARRAIPGLRPQSRHVVQAAHAEKHYKINSFQRFIHKRQSPKSP